MTHLAINFTLLPVLSLLFMQCKSAGLQQVYRKLAEERQTFLSESLPSDPNKAAAHVKAAPAASPYAGNLQQLWLIFSLPRTQNNAHMCSAVDPLSSV